MDCQEPWTVTIIPGIPWTYYLDVALLLFFYFILALEIRRRLEPVCLHDCCMIIQFGCYVML